MVKCLGIRCGLGQRNLGIDRKLFCRAIVGHAIALQICDWIWAGGSHRRVEEGKRRHLRRRRNSRIRPDGDIYAWPRVENEIPRRSARGERICQRSFIAVRIDRRKICGSGQVNRDEAPGP